MALRFDGQVAIVTGAGGSLGRQYALHLSAAGAKVVVNDYSPVAAQKVVDEIKARGGEAVPNSDSVTEGEKVVQTAIDTWNRIDIVVNNAGILRDVSFQRMSPQQWHQVIEVHLKGAYSVSRAAWPHMRKAQYGRIVMVSSVAGLYGSFGQANYSSAKMGVVGMAKTLAKEGAKKGIKVNAVVPGAGSAMTQTILPPKITEAWKPDYVAPFVAYMCHKSFQPSGRIFEVGGGFCGEVHWMRTKGVFMDLDKPYTVDDVGAVWSKVTDTTGESDPEKIKGPGPQLEQVLKKIQNQPKEKSAL